MSDRLGFGERFTLLDYLSQLRAGDYFEDRRPHLAISDPVVEHHLPDVLQQSHMSVNELAALDELLILAAFRPVGGFAE